MRQRQKTVLNCFSPPVMIATMTVEAGLAFYALWRYKLSGVIKLSVLMLAGLATFQLAEYFVCSGQNAVSWSRIGFVAITALPPLGLHLVHKLSGKPEGKLVLSAYASMLAFMAYFLVAKSAFADHQCTGNYVIFHLAPNAGGLYFTYYYGWLFAAIGLGIMWGKEMASKGQSIRRRSEAVQGLIAGYLVFLIPTTVLNTISPSTIDGLPSVMCGFAVLYALILGFYILPRAAERR